MGLYEDIGTVRRLWKDASFISKIFLVVSAFFALGSIATLSDVVFHWKGFILDGVNFYNRYVTSFIGKFVSFFGGTINQYWSNYYLLYFLVVAGHFRTIQLNRGTRYFSFGVVLIFAFVAFGLFGLVLRSSADAVILGFEFYTLIILHFGPPLLFKTTLESKYLFYSPVILAVTIVLILGAVNSGLTRPT